MGQKLSQKSEHCQYGHVHQMAAVKLSICITRNVNSRPVLSNGHMEDLPRVPDRKGPQAEADIDFKLIKTTLHFCRSVGLFSYYDVSKPRVCF